jgi:hypothetical protein
LQHAGESFFKNVHFALDSPIIMIYFIIKQRAKSPQTQTRRDTMKQIAEAITESKNTDSIIHLTITAADIHEVMDGIDYDDAVLVDGVYDVWGDNWRLAVTIEPTAHKFHDLEASENYDIIDAETGHWITQGIQGADAMATTWPESSEAWPAGEDDFSGNPEDVAR